MVEEWEHKLHGVVGGAVQGQNAEWTNSFFFIIKNNNNYINLRLAKKSAIN